MRAPEHCGRSINLGLHFMRLLLHDQHFFFFFYTGSKHICMSIVHYSFLESYIDNTWAGLTFLHLARKLRACDSMGRASDSKSQGLGFDSHCWSYVQVVSKLLIPCHLLLPSNTRYLVDEKLCLSGSSCQDTCMTWMMRLSKSVSHIVLFKMFSRWFFANNKIIITLRTSKVGDVT